MEVERVRRWIEKMQKTETLLPIITHEGRDLTPLEIKEEIERATPRGKAIYSALEKRQFHLLVGDEHSLWNLAKRRVLKLIDICPVTIRTLNIYFPIITPEQLRRDVEMEGHVGKTFIKLHVKRIKQLLERF
jgi:uncharacterized NAD-dependent epimerase/dehydratase family protein